MNQEAKQNILWLRAYSKLLDSQFKIPYLNYTFGIDPILSIIPIVGSLAGVILSIPIFYFAYHHKASNKLLILMLKNTVLDTLIGEIPLFGVFGDVYVKSNIKNIQLIEEHFTENKHQGSGLKLVIVFLVLLFVLFIGLFLIILFLFHKLLQFIGKI